MSQTKRIDDPMDSSIVNDEEKLPDQVIDYQFRKHPDFRIIELYEDDDYPEGD